MTGPRHGNILEAHGGAEVQCDDTLDLFIIKVRRHITGAAGLVNPQPKERVVVSMSEATWQAICDDDEAEGQFYEDLETRVHEWAEGPLMRYLVTDSGKYGEAARAALARQRAEQTDGLDHLEQLRAEIESLVLQAAEMRSRPSRAQAVNFGQRLGELVERVEEQRQRLRQIDALVDFAKVAIVDAADLQPAEPGRKVGTATAGAF